MIPEIKRVLFATDLSENSRHAFHYAAAIASRFDADMILIHVMESAPHGAQEQLRALFGEEKWSEMQEEHQQSARDVLIGKRTDYDLIRRALDRLCTDANEASARCSFEAVEVLVTQGKVVERILGAAADKHCDLIVLGAHKGLLGKTAVGTIAKAVLHGSRVPVVVVPPPAAS
ncbi:MAG TPA: universal stress protein [Deferrisomatales bacterium]|nr:universal stress protein [Deferrisomatales bacterium]